MSVFGHHLANCRICPNDCGVDRAAGHLGRCGTGADIVVSSSGLHFGEERVLVGRGGSGTIFLSGCSLSCVYCQNWDISQRSSGRVYSVPQAAWLMLSLQERGAENINLVTPTHQAPRLFEAVVRARSQGLRIPIVYNGSGYECVRTLRELAGLVEIYMPDMKYGSDQAGERYSGVRGYWRCATAAIEEMHRQVGTLELDDRGVARRGLIVRHLVLPADIAGSRSVLDFLAARISTDTAINILDQYHPAYRASEHAALRARVPREAVEEVRAYAQRLGLRGLLA